MGRIGPDELGHLFDAQAGALVLYARSLSDVPDDLVQEAFAALARQRVAPERPAAWLFTVVRRAAIDASRRDRRRRRREAAASPGEAWFASADDRIDADRAARLLAELPAGLREVIVARIWGGLTFDEVARLQGCSLTTAHRRYQDGLARLHERLERPCTLAPDRTT